MLGIIKKLKETAEKGVEKGVELSVKGYDSAKEAAKKGYEKAKEEERHSKISKASESSKDTEHGSNDKSTPKEYLDAVKMLKLRFAKGEITEEEYLKNKKILEE